MTHPDIEAMAQELWGSSIGGEHYHYNEIDAYTKQPHWKKKIPEALAAWSLALSRLREPSEAMLVHGHAAGVRQDDIWQNIDHPMALRLQKHYMRGAIHGAIDAKARELGIGEGG